MKNYLLLVGLAGLVVTVVPQFVTMMLLRLKKSARVIIATDTT